MKKSDSDKAAKQADWELYKYIRSIVDKQGVKAGIEAMKDATGETDPLYLANQVFAHCI